MRDSILRKAVACCGLAVVAAAALSGCGDDDESTGTASSTSVAAATSAAPAQADAATTKAITDVYTGFFSPSTPPDQKAALVQKGDVFLPILQAQAANPQSQGTSVTVSAVKLVDANNADVTYTLLMGGNPVLPNQTGQAVKDGGQWKVATATFCALMTLQGGTSPAC
ncbi:hypothetical protein [Nocardia gamkensis]|uniref:Low molecular weight antigen MTB12-like C-terminal domain-containing protein n=1 Tax=Nocardia gamkensis TaxID=352869 RepID=A0A7X6KZV7_9NOCA|nr:hypothetical protein [Nocardia gamkensis]NKY25242.1 hypothetical protein [Nocardia gamkensis]NQE70238.1 hypothetical protein [Nocardia gamkensis]